MQTIPFTLFLLSDAEPGSGQGSQLVDSFLTKDHNRHPVVRASHLKGLMRQRLRDIALPLVGKDDINKADELVQAVFGRMGSGGDDGASSRIQLCDLGVDGDAQTLTVTRTALNDLGTVAGLSLRTVEALSCGTVLNGTLHLDSVPGSVVDTAARLALCAVEAIGGGRNRGGGVCNITISGDDRYPGTLLKELMEGIKRDGIPEPLTITTAAQATTLNPQDAPVWLRLIFRAGSPVCCPETPVVGNNVIRSGIQIPASAVQGAILHRLSRVNDALASACFADKRFRAWPLLPASPDTGDQALPIPFYCSMTHRMSKLPIDQEKNKYLFKDASIAPYNWSEVPNGAPLKATGGVLLRSSDGGVQLWRAAAIPRVLSAHGVHRDGIGERNLFTVEAVAPLSWCGLVAMPSEAAATLQQSLSKDPRMVFGKARSVRGDGTLEVQVLQDNALDPPPLANDMTGRVFVVQSPLAIPDEIQMIRCENVLADLVASSGWGTVRECHATAAVRFGWNRHGLGSSAGRNKRLRAIRCILPGSVVVLENPLADTRGKLLQGIGEGRRGGYGALLPHPGIADKAFLPSHTITVKRSTDDVGKVGLNLWRKATSRGPTPAQIASLMGRLKQDKVKTVRYLDTQLSRPERIYRRWKNIINDTRDLIDENSVDHALGALRVWQDLAIVHRSKEVR